MALDKTTLENNLLEILSKPKTSTNVRWIAKEIADTIHQYVQTGTITSVSSDGSIITNTNIL